MKLRDKGAPIPEAGSGMGRASALRFAREGARVLVVDAGAGHAVETER